MVLDWIVPPLLLAVTYSPVPLFGCLNITTILVNNPETVVAGSVAHFDSSNWISGLTQEEVEDF